MTENGKVNGWLKLLGTVVTLILSMLALFFTMIRPAVSNAVAEQLKTEAEVRQTEDQKNYGDHQRMEDRLDKRLDRMERKLDDLLERK